MVESGWGARSLTPSLVPSLHSISSFLVREASSPRDGSARPASPGEGAVVGPPKPCRAPETKGDVSVPRQGSQV